MMLASDDPETAAELGIEAWMRVAAALLDGASMPGSKGAADRATLGRIYRAKWAAGEAGAAGKGAGAEAMLGKLTAALTGGLGNGRVIDVPSSPSGHAAVTHSKPPRPKLPF